MSGVDWTKFGQRAVAPTAQASALRSGGDLVIPFEQWPRSVQDAVASASRPKVTTAAEVDPFTKYVAANSGEYSERLRASMAGDPAAVAWGVEQMRARGYVEVPWLSQFTAPRWTLDPRPGDEPWEPPTGTLWRRADGDVFWHGDFFSGVGAGVWHAFAEEAREQEQLRSSAAVTERHDARLDGPTDESEAVGLDVLAERLDMSERRARDHVRRLVESGAWREKEVPSERGGKPRKLYWRVVVAGEDGDAAPSA